MFPAPESNYITKIIIPEKSEWRTELHWHELYDEYICVRKGRILVTIGDVTRECGPEDGDVKIPKFTVHEFMRSDIDLKDEEKEAGDVEVWERTDPGIGLHLPLCLLPTSFSGWLEGGVLPQFGLGHHRTS